MRIFYKIFKYFTWTEWLIWLISVTLLSASFFALDGTGYFSYAASLVGVTALILCAKGNPIGQILCILFGLMYAVISFTFSYYGEVIIYMCMSVPMAVLSLVSWLKNPFEGNKSEVTVNSISKKEVPLIFLLAAAVTCIMYFALKYFGTANLIPSTFSVFSSFVAVYLTLRRSPYFAIAYAVNDVVLVSLWLLACFEDIGYLSVVICFGVFLINDVYGFINWIKMQKKQSKLTTLI